MDNLIADKQDADSVDAEKMSAEDQTIVMTSMMLLLLTVGVFLTGSLVLIVRRHEHIRRKLSHLLGQLDISETVHAYQVRTATLVTPSVVVVHSLAVVTVFFYLHFSSYFVIKQRDCLSIRLLSFSSCLLSCNPFCFKRQTEITFLLLFSCFFLSVFVFFSRPQFLPVLLLL